MVSFLVKTYSGDDTLDERETFIFLSDVYFAHPQYRDVFEDVGTVPIIIASRAGTTREAFIYFDNYYYDYYYDYYYYYCK